MTIQLPVLLWTVICFVLLMLILSRLLFRPLLDFMDRREEKIRSAARKLEETEQARRDAEEKLARFRQEEAERTDRLSKEAVAEAEREAAAILAPSVALLTPNLPEAAKLLGLAPDSIRSADDMVSIPNMRVVKLRRIVPVSFLLLFLAVM